MKDIYKKLSLLALCAIVAGKLCAQDPEFTQFYANPLYLNPALAGNKICPRLTLNYRQQWPSIGGLYSTVGFSYDRLLPQIKGGVGFMVMSDRAAQGTLNTTGIGAIYAPTIPISNFSTITFAIQAGYWQKNVNWSKLTFGDQIDPAHGFTGLTAETPFASTSKNFDVHTGILFSTTHLFIGAAVHHIFEPNESFLDGTSPLPRKYTIHAGGIIPLTESKIEGECYISPNILYQQQGDFRQLNIGLYVKKNSIVGGLWYRNNDSFILLLGVEAGQFRLGYSYDMTISKLTNASGGSHEISAGYQFSCKPMKRKYRPGICPSW